MYSVNLYGSHPDANNDDCWAGDEFETKEEALRVFNNPWEYFSVRYHESSTAFVEIDGPDINRVRKNPTFKPSKKDSAFDRDWKRERAYEAGMCLGIDAYNDTMGY